jgi:hypothetical protein
MGMMSSGGMHGGMGMMSSGGMHGMKGGMMVSSNHFFPVLTRLPT